MRPGPVTSAVMARRIEVFVAAYAVSFNGPEAAIAAGYAPTCAKNRAWEMLQRPDVQAALKAHQARKLAKLEVEADVVVRELAYCGLYDIGRLFTPEGFLKAPADIDEMTRRAIVSVEQETRTERSRRTIGGDGEVEEPTAEITKVRFKLADKVQSLVALARHFGVFEKDNAQAGAADVRAILAAIDPGKVDLRPHFLGGPGSSVKPAANDRGRVEEQPRQAGVRLLDRIGGGK